MGMRSWITLGLVATAALCWPAVAGAAGWLRDVDHALNVAEVQQRPVLLFISMDGCHYCTKMIETTLSDQRVCQTLGQRFVPAAIKGSERPDILKDLKIRSFPTTLVVSPDGEVLDQMVGYVDAKKFQKRLERFSQPPAATSAQAPQPPVPPGYASY